MIQAIIFDLNGIFIQSPKLSERFEKDFNIPSSEFLPKLADIMAKVRMPDAGDAFQYWQPALEQWDIKFTEQEFWKYWFEIETVSEKMVNFAKELKAQDIKIFILSNNFKERALYYGHYPWINEAVDKVYFSWQSGFVKPDPRAWTNLLSENNLTPSDCIYFDDLEKNIKAAESLGIKSYMFTNEEDFEQTIAEHI